MSDHYESPFNRFATNEALDAFFSEDWLERAQRESAYDDCSYYDEPEIHWADDLCERFMDDRDDDYFDSLGVDDEDYDPELDRSLFDNFEALPKREPVSYKTHYGFHCHMNDARRRVDRARSRRSDRRRERKLVYVNKTAYLN